MWALGWGACWLAVRLQPWGSGTGNGWVRGARGWFAGGLCARGGEELAWRFLRRRAGGSKKVAVAALVAW